ncbi:hypothetical protein [Dasania marina]|uniref:hypothetical protein n=1 Tax=Dasania marina TaxID=471499 RepID=UPI000363A440|nr:hypothetical protein [Dasania marina]|tara:strand:- start:144301 stop:144525 length:225 start_codon:yes stop_codon:yes gene_type:complete
MNEQKKVPVDTETILMTLDQLSQTIEIMTTVVGRLRHYVCEQQQAAPHNLPSNSKNTNLKDIEESLKPISTTLH